MSIKETLGIARRSGIHNWGLFAGCWFVIICGMYLWAIRGTFGLRGNVPFSIEVGTSSGPVDIGCTIQTPLRPNHKYDLICEARGAAPVGSSFPFEISMTASGNGFLVSPLDQRVGLKPNEFQPLTFQVTPIASGIQNLAIGINAGDVTRAAQWALDIEFKPIEIFFVSLAFALPLTFFYRQVRGAITARDQLKAKTDARIAAVESKAEQAPEKAKFAWELATVRLEAYFDKNLSQVNQVFWLAVSVTVIGFCFVLWGIIASLDQPQITARALVAGVSGIITQFIGATFLVIYRSIMTQANEFIGVLERINTVGMAVQVLDSIPEDQVSLKKLDPLKLGDPVA